MRKYVFTFLSLSPPRIYYFIQRGDSIISKICQTQSRILRLKSGIAALKRQNNSVVHIRRRRTSRKKVITYSSYASQPLRSLRNIERNINEGVCFCRRCGFELFRAGFDCARQDIISFPRFYASTCIVRVVAPQFRIRRLLLGS